MRSLNEKLLRPEPTALHISQLVAVSPDGEVAIAFNNNPMKHSCRVQGGEHVVAALKEETG
ncbi:hypothetical protein [Pontibacter russatus]|uniref:hypothetical protein n=1 Tax=Pontibacter russatus TaxID=2694929 RepID=UPI00137B0EC3|nr:hypothetical protein [Pontibacter russatus]